MKKRFQKLPKWLRIVLCVAGVLLGLILIVMIALKIWVSTWKKYKNDDFGFSFKYPSNWYISGNPITPKTISKAGDFMVFWIDSKEKLPRNGLDVVRSPGDVEVWIYKKPTTFLNEKLSEWNKYGSYKTVKYGEKLGFVNNTTNVSIPLGGIRVYSKQVIVETDNYVYYPNTVTFLDKKVFLSDVKTRFYHWIGSEILGSFIFTK